MKQIFQSLKNGETIIAEIPPPNNKKGHLLLFEKLIKIISSNDQK